MRLVRSSDLTPPFVLALLAAAAWPLAALALGPRAAVVLAALVLGLIVALRSVERIVAAVLVLTPLAGASIDVLGLSVLPARPVKLVIYAVPAAVIVCGLALARTRRMRPPWGIAVAFAAFLAVSLAASMQGLRAEAATTPLVHLLGSAMLFIAVCLIGDTRERLRVLIAGALGGLVVAGAQGTFGSLLGVETLYGFATPDSVVARAQGSFFHPNMYGLFLAMLLPLAVAVAVNRSFGAALRWLASAAIAVGAPALVMSYSRGAVAGLVVGAFIWLIAMRPRDVLAYLASLFGGRPVIPIAALAVVSIVLLPSSVQERFVSASTRSDLTQRGAVWRAALDTYAEHPILGVGVGAFPDAYARGSSEAPRAGQRPLLNQGDVASLPYHAHNAFLTVAAEQGSLGLLALLALATAAVSIAVRACRLRDPAGRAIGMSAGTALAVWTVYDIVNVSLYEDTALPLAALLALAWCFVVLEEREDVEAS